MTVTPRLVDPPVFDNFPANLAVQSEANVYRAVVSGWHDADTGHFLVRLGFGAYVNADVRVQGCNAPELSTQAGKDALAFVLASWPPGTPVLLIPERDFAMSFARYVCRVTVPVNADLAAILIQTGHAVPMAGVSE